jgi:hypothetical protein
MATGRPQWCRICLGSGGGSDRNADSVNDGIGESDGNVMMSRRWAAKARP